MFFLEKLNQYWWSWNRLDSERLVAQFHETEKINFVLHGDFLGLLVMEFRVGYGFERWKNNKYVTV